MDIRSLPDSPVDVLLFVAAHLLSQGCKAMLADGFHDPKSYYLADRP